MSCAYGKAAARVGSSRLVALGFRLFRSLLRDNFQQRQVNQLTKTSKVMEPGKVSNRRCAIYTRKSSEEVCLLKT